MAGGLLQLVAYGAQDQFLTGDPVITFFKAVYRHHTNFAMESIAQTANGTPNNDNKVSYVLARNGDLVTDCWFEVSNTSNTHANSLIKSVELEIGGQRIDRHTGDWLQIWNELSLSSSKLAAYNRMQKKTTGTSDTCYIPLQFFFCRNPGLALPLIALQYHEVKIIVEFESVANSYTCPSDIKLYTNYIYLDVDERRRFAQTSHQLLIEQVQHAYDTLSQSVRINFNHPVKELIWTISDNTAFGGNKSGTVTSPDYAAVSGSAAPTDSFTTAQLKLNNQDRFSERIPEYFRTVQPFQYHTNVPNLVAPIYVYSFALKPEEHQPSGSCNFSRIDNAYLNLPGAASNKTIKLFAVNYNVLRITSGMGGLAFSN